MNLTHAEKGEKKEGKTRQAEAAYAAVAVTATATARVIIFLASSWLCFDTESPCPYPQNKNRQAEAACAAVAVTATTAASLHIFWGTSKLSLYRYMAPPSKTTDLQDTAQAEHNNGERGKKKAEAAWQLRP